MNETDKTAELSLKQILLILKDKIFWLIFAVLLGAVVAGCVSVLFMPKLYTAEVQLYISATGTNESSVQNSYLQAGETLASNYSVILENEDVIAEVASNISTEMSVSEVRNALSISAVSNTSVLQVSAKTKDPELSAEICNTMAKIAPTVLKRVTKAGSAEAINVAKIPNSPSSPNVKKNILIGALACFIVAVLIILAMYLFDNKVKGEEDLKRRLGVPVLGTLPTFENKKGRWEDAKR